MLRQMMANAEEILSDVATALETGKVQTDDSHSLLAWDIGADRAGAGIHPKESLDAASIFFRIALSTLSELLREHPDYVRLFNIVTLSLEQSISTRIRAASESYTSFLLNKMHEVQVEERRRIARELHDRIGHGISVVHQQLELYEFHHSTEPARALVNVELAEQAIQETMRNLRQVTSELHPHEPLKSLEKALLGYLATVETGDVAVHLHVNGDETWASPEVRDESFLIFREATRNALAHAQASMILIRIDIAPHELLGFVRDNGRGFAVDQVPNTGSMGLISMRERAELLGGTITVTSDPVEGTCVDLHMPLPGRLDE
ncbi:MULTISPECIES: sensor histidine kinase [Streptosporangium]|uniref:Signal transduction histidine kinase n=1 Tax=Streptosporangium brasiliense TaxID=47480 RepID=A0ABT9QWZ4_9ACTN|nr:sensor histidine kinase [Streptosporangium brasiliense]MDP9861392.1 signal transduction histidine kinase [Streptosporangium brasiliense]